MFQGAGGGAEAMGVAGEEKQREKIRGEISNTVINGFRGNNSLYRRGRRCQEKLSVNFGMLDMN